MEMFAVDGTWLPVQIMKLSRESIRRTGRGEILTLDGIQHFDPVGATFRYRMEFRAQPAQMTQLWGILSQNLSHSYTFPWGGQMVQKQMYAQNLSQTGDRLTATFVEVGQ